MPKLKCLIGAVVLTQLIASSALAECDQEHSRVNLLNYEVTACRLLFENVNADKSVEDGVGRQSTDLLIAMIASSAQGQMKAAVAEEFEAAAEIDFFRAEASTTSTQVGVGAGESGSTSLTEKPGIQQALSWAVERGAVTQDRVGTAMRFSTSPYSMVTLFNEDTMTNYEQYGWLSRLGIAVSVPVSDEADDSPAGPQVDQISEVNVRVQLLGGASARSSDFARVWRERVAPASANALAAENAIVRLTDEFLGTSAGSLGKSVGALKKDFGDRVTALVKDRALNSSATDIAEIIQEIEPEVRQLTELFLTENGILPLSQSRAEEVAPGLANIETAYQEYGDVRDANSTKDILRELYPHSLTMSYSFHPVEGGGDYSDAALFYQYDVTDRAVAVLNAKLSFNPTPSDALDQKKVRSYSAAGTLEVPIEFEFLGGSADDDMTPTVLSASAGVIREEEANHTIATALIKFEIPIAAGISIPLAANYASRTVSSSKDELRVSLGLQMDGGKYLSWRNLRDKLGALP